MVRKYRVRNRDVELDEFPEIVALRGEAQGPAEPAQRMDGQGAFEKQGWRFVSRDQVQPAAERETRQQVANIYRKRRGGQLVLNLNRATVKFKATASAEQVESALRLAGAQIVQRLTMAANLFTIEFAPGRDVFEGVETLSSMSSCEFAEPELVEEIGGR